MVYKYVVCGVWCGMWCVLGLNTDHSDGEVVVDDVVRDVLHDLVDWLRFVSLLVVNTDPPPVQLGGP